MASGARNLIRMLLGVLVCAASLQFAAPARAETVTVCPTGCDFATIAAALQAADDGDTISIGEGTYAGGVEVRKNVTLRGAGRDTTTIQGTAEASVVRVKAGANVRIEAVTITGGGGSLVGPTARGGGILNEGDLSLFDSIVRGNTAAGGEGGGIFSGSSKLVKIRNSDILGNEAADGGGIFIGRGDVVIEDSIIGDNRATRNGGGIYDHSGETLRLERSAVSNNRADFSVGGISSSDELVLIDSEVVGNRAVNVGGIAGGRELLKIAGSTIRGNVSGGSGGGLRVGSGGVALVDSVVEQNQTTGANGGGIFANNLSGDISLKATTVSGNVARQDGGGILNEKSEIVLDNSKVIDNQAGRLGGGIYSRTATKGLIKVRNGSVVSGNQPDQCYPAGLRC